MSFVLDGAMAGKINDAVSARSDFRSVSAQEDGADGSRSIVADAAGKGAYLDIALKGDWSDSASIPVKDGAAATFDEIPVGAVIWAEAEIYTSVDGERLVFYTGTSGKLKIKSGENQLSLSLKKVSSDDTDDETGTSTKPDGSDTQDEPADAADNPDEPAVVLPLYVSASGSNETGDGTEKNPLASIAAACGKMDDATAAYAIYVDGMLTAGQMISATLSSDSASETATSFAKSVMIVGAAGDGTDGINVTEGCALTVRSNVPVTVKNLSVTYKVLALYVLEGASLTLEDGVSFTPNDTNYTSSSSESVSLAGSLTMKGNSLLTLTRYSYNSMKITGSLTMNDSAKITGGNGTTASKGGITIYGGTMVMNGSSSVTNTTGIDAGISIDNKGSLTMNGSSYIKGCTGTGSSLPGGVYVRYGTFTMNDNAAVVGNTANMGYGGVGVSMSGKFVMNGGYISGNYSNADTAYGAGVNCNGTFIMNGGSIGGTVTVDGTEYGANTYKSAVCGSGLYLATGYTTQQTCTFKISGNAKFENGSDIYIDNTYNNLDYSIKITGALSSGNSYTITPKNYTAGKSLLAVESGADTTLEKEVGKFIVADDDESDNYRWSIASDGTLVKYEISQSTFYVSANGDDDTGDGTEDNPLASISGAVSKMNNADLDYTILIDGTLTAAQSIPATLTAEDASDTATSFAKSVTIVGVAGDGSDGISVSSTALATDYSLAVATTVPVTLKNILVTSKASKPLSVSASSSVMLENATLSNTNSSSFNASKGVLVEGSLTMNGSSKISGLNLLGYTVYLSSSKSMLTMNGTSQISDGKATDGGGGVYVNGGTMIMNENASISDCTGAGGGGVCVSGGSLTMNDSTSITGCNGNGSTGGGVRVGTNGSFTMNGNASIIGCTGGTYQYMSGGGVFVDSSATFTMNGGNISENIATTGSTNLSMGAGVYNAGTFTMAGGSIGANTYSNTSYAGYGSGVYNAGTFTMSGSANIESDNDLYLDTTNNKLIKIVGGLTAAAPVATITLPASEYKDGTQLFDATGDVAANYTKFALTPPADGSAWEIGSDGKLAQSATGSGNSSSSGSGSSGNGTGNGSGTSGAGTTASPDVYWSVTDNGTVLRLYGSEGEGRTGPIVQNAAANSSTIDWIDQCDEVSLIVVEEKIAPTCMNSWFRDLGELTEIQGMSNIDTSNVTDMSHLFWGSTKLKWVDDPDLEDDIDLVDLSGFDTANVIDMSGMFAGIAATELDLSSFDTSKVTNMDFMFGYTDYEESVLTTIYVSNKFVTTGLVTDDKTLADVDMFAYCFALVGGNGTRCDDYYKRFATYACIDTDDTPGYFTRKQQP